MKRIVAIAITIAALVAPAKAEPYAGLAIGAGVGQIGAQGVDIDTEGFVGSAFIGYNHAIKGVVVGIEGDVSLGGINGSIHSGAVTISSDSAWVATLRARLGMKATDALMFYITGGVAFDQTSIDAVAGATKLTADDIQIGWVVGAGAELYLTKTIGLRAEVRHTSFDDFNFSGISLDSQKTTALLGLVVKLN